MGGCDGVVVAGTVEELDGNLGPMSATEIDRWELEGSGWRPRLVGPSKVL